MATKSKRTNNKNSKIFTRDCLKTSKAKLNRPLQDKEQVNKILGLSPVHT